MTAASPQTAMAALERLATALGPGEFATVLVARPGQPPRLSVISRHTLAGEDIYADARCYWRGQGEPVAGAEDPLTAAHRVATILRAVPEPARDW